MDDQAEEFERFHCWRAGWRDAVLCRVYQARYARHARGDLRLAYFEGYDEGTQLRCDAERKAMARIGYKPNVLRATKLDPEVDRDLRDFEEADTGEYAVAIPGGGRYPKTELPE